MRAIARPITQSVAKKFAHIFNKVRHGIEAAFRKRTAAPQPRSRKPNATRCAVPRDRFGGIMRAGWIKLATHWHQRSKNRLIETDAGKQEPRCRPARPSLLR